MHLDISHVTLASGKTYRRALLRESFRQGRKVCKRTIANLSHLTDVQLDALQVVLRHQGPEPLSCTSGKVALAQGKSIGAVATVLAVAERLGLRAALGEDRQGLLALYQVLARVLDQGSRLSAVRFGREHALAELLGLSRLDEDDLYANLAWLHAQQALIEDRLFASRCAAAGVRPNLFLYDVTSSYFEGTDNALAAFGYNRDGKRGKKQLVAGLLTDQDGTPLTIELFPGNTADPTTVPSQVAKLRQRFGGGELTLVGDRGMLKAPQQQLLAEEGMRYLTAITRPQLQTLLKRGVLQLELFEQDLAEVTDPQSGKRYLLRRNPEQAKRLAHRRADQLATWRRHLDRANAYLAEHPRASVQTALRRLAARATRLKLSPWLSATAEGRHLHEVIDQAALAEAAQLDGCYVLETDLPPALADKATLDERYHDLAQVEWAFRTCKTAHLELRPIYLRHEQRTRGHALVVMLAYQVVRHLADCWHALDVTVEEGLAELGQLCLTEVRVGDACQAWQVPQPRAMPAQLLAAAHVTLPAAIGLPATTVDTKVKLPTRRKSRSCNTLANTPIAQ